MSGTLHFLMIPEPTSGASGPDDEINDFRESLLNDIRDNRTILPSLPDIALRIRDVAGDPNADAAAIAKVINTDPAIAARIIKVANSALYQRQKKKVSDLRVAIARIGITLVKTLATNLAIVQLMRSPSRAMERHLKQLFKHSMEVAALSFALARVNGQINPETAMLAGSVHDIGSLPVLQKALGTKTLRDDETRIDRLLSALHPEIGGVVLQTWGFADDLVSVARDHEKIFRGNPGAPDIVDIVIVANLNLRDRNEVARQSLVMSNVSAFSRLEIDPLGDLRTDPDVSGPFDYAMSLLHLDK